MKNFILYKGPSVLDGNPIVVIAIMSSKNSKTGNMVQTHIIREDIHPVEAQETGDDKSVCGNCPLRQGIGGACYVQVWQGPASVYNAYKNGKYAELSASEVRSALKNKVVRLGAYGDPAAVPFEVWQNALAESRGNTGYTHQLNHKNFDKRVLKFCMVSVDTPKQAKEAHLRGLRTYRVITKNAPLLKNEIMCPSINGVSCVECKMCNDATSKSKSLAIVVHGTRFKKHTNKYENVNLIAVGG